jgi:hypothetical protein
MPKRTVKSAHTEVTRRTRSVAIELTANLHRLESTVRRVHQSSEELHEAIKAVEKLTARPLVNRVTADSAVHGLHGMIAGERGGGRADDPVREASASLESVRNKRRLLASADESALAIYPPPKGARFQINSPSARLGERRPGS